MWNRPLRIGYPDDATSTTCRWSAGSTIATVSAAAVEMDLRDTLRNPWGILHGGVTAALVDAARRARDGWR